MALFLNKISAKAKTEINTGFGNSATSYGGRLVNKNGKPNVKKIGVPLLDSISWYHTLLELPRWKFFTIIFMFYIVINLLFTCIYYFVGIEHLGGMETNSVLEQFIEAYFFSAQTFTTVGYGRINPIGFITSGIAAIEALVGLLSFAIATGLFYGRFSKQEAFLQYSNNALIAPFKDGVALVLRISPYKNTTLTDAEAKITIGIMIEDEEGKPKTEFFSAALEYSSVNSLTLSWTIVHPINEESPFYKFTKEDFSKTKGEIIVFVKAFDDMFSNEVVSRTSYVFDEIIIGAKFNLMYYRDNNDNQTILNLEKINDYTKVNVDHLLPANQKHT